ncbi:hypothetical protein [Sulfuriroseicoccus oceanibius]|uniref:Uncharacterized protein n=1 Tax=Sulfuriroseicoccus oceanibius TaxID=2707525 RepID=A0A6B3LAM8_9BACT|nr:hypothetical protein [Sulfuriroseicoccus oceanibius]QQL45522.1 hypothetical protein G3M56_002725 [Sulfuriroseicoccus oceanibius]
MKPDVERFRQDRLVIQQRVRGFVAAEEGVSTQLAKNLIRAFQDVGQIKELTVSGVEMLEDDIRSGRCSVDQLLIAMLHIDEQTVRDSFVQGRDAVVSLNNLVRISTVDPEDTLVEKSIFYDLALSSIEGAESDRLVKGIKENESLAFRAAVVRSIRFLQNENVLDAVIEEYLEDTRDVVLGGPTGIGFNFRVCDITVHEFHKRYRVGVFGIPGVRVSDSELKRVKELHLNASERRERRHEASIQDMGAESSSEDEAEVGDSRAYLWWGASILLAVLAYLIKMRLSERSPGRD